MKINFTLLFILAYLLVSCSGDPEKHAGSLSGKWSGKLYGNNSWELIFNKDGSFTCLREGAIYPMCESNQSIKWESDESKDPSWIDLVITDTTTQEEVGKLKGLYKYDDDGRQIVEMCFNGSLVYRFSNDKLETRPTQIISNDYHFVLRKE